ncbi:HIT family protein [Candidatus Woesearchaeota archaeon]|nr:HIT family protein [Candidatus Woesearchaeota archaeon]
MQLTPEIKAQLAEQKKNCPYCLLLKGEIPSSSVYEDKFMNAVMHIDNWRDGHILLLPKEHYPILPLMPAEEFKHIFGKIPRFIKALKKSTLSLGSNVFIANGGPAGQQMPHFCINIIPRDNSDRFDNFSF